MTEASAPHQIEATVPTTVEAHAVTNFQLIPDNGGFILLLGKRRFTLGPDAFGGHPAPGVEVFAAGFLAHAMLKDLARVLNMVVGDFERLYGKVPVPGVDPAQPLTGRDEKPGV